AALDDEQGLARFSQPGLLATEDGQLLRTDTLVVAEAAELERATNAETLRKIRDISLVSLGGLFIVSLGVAWVVAGRMLRPVDTMTAAAQGIDASSLSRRLALDGPDHELKQL